MVTKYQRNGIWYVDYRVKGRRIRKRIGKSKKVAHDVVSNIENKLCQKEAGIYVDDISLNLFLDKINEYIKTNLRPSTGLRYKEAIDSFLKFLYNKDVDRLSELTPEIFEEFKNERVKAVRNATVNMEIKIWKIFLNLATKWNYIRSNPLKQVAFLPALDRKFPRFYSKEEARRIIKATPQPYKDIFLFLLLTGMRRNELRHLEVGDIDLYRKIIKVSVKRGFLPKTKERAIPIHKDLMPIIKKHLDVRKSGILLPNAHGKVYAPRQWWKVLRVIAQKEEIPNATIHAFRHTFASWLIMSGVDLRTVGRLLGHSDIKTTLIYSHLAQDHIDQSINKLAF